MATKSTPGVQAIVAALKAKQKEKEEKEYKQTQPTPTPSRSSIGGGGAKTPPPTTQTAADIGQSLLERQTAERQRRGLQTIDTQSFREVQRRQATRTLVRATPPIKSITRPTTKTAADIDQSLLERQTAERQRRGLQTIGTTSFMDVFEKVRRTRGRSQEIKIPKKRVGRAPSPEEARMLQSATGELRALTPEQQKELKKSRSPIRQFFRGLISPEEEAIKTEGETTPATQLGAFVGIPLLGIPAGKLAKAPKAISLVAKASKVAIAAKAAEVAAKAPRLAKAATAASKTRFARYLKDIGIAGAEAVAVPVAGKKIGEVTAPSEQREAFRAGIVKPAITAGVQKQREIAKGQSLVKSIANEFSIAFGSKPAFEAGVRESLTEQGITGKQKEAAVEAALRQRKFIAGSEAFSLLNIARLSERIGRKAVGEAFELAAKKGIQIPKKKVGRELIKQTFIPIAKAGAIEGAASQLTQDIAREQDINLKNVGLGAGLGFVSAGLIGSVGIAGTRIPTPKVSKIIEVGSFIVDPFEKPGDILADIQGAAIRRVTGKAPRTPIITETIKPEDIFGIGIKKSKAPAQPKKTQRGSGIFTFGISAPTLTPVQVPVLTPPTKVKVPTLIKIPSFISIPKPTPTPTPTPVPVQPKIPIDIPGFIPIQTKVPVPIQAPISFPTTIPTTTPQLRFPPPLPFQLPFAFGAGGTRIGKRKVFINELEAGRRLLASLTGGIRSDIIFNPQILAGKKKKKKKRR